MVKKMCDEKTCDRCGRQAELLNWEGLDLCWFCYKMQQLEDERDYFGEGEE